MVKESTPVIDSVDELRERLKIVELKLNHVSKPPKAANARSQELREHDRTAPLDN